ARTEMSTSTAAWCPPPGGRRPPRWSGRRTCTAAPAAGGTTASSRRTRSGGETCFARSRRTTGHRSGGRFDSTRWDSTRKSCASSPPSASESAHGPGDRAPVLQLHHRLPGAVAIDVRVEHRVPVVDDLEEERDHRDDQRSLECHPLHSGLLRILC